MCVCILNHVSSDFLFFNYLFVEVTLATTLYKLHVNNNIFLFTKNSVSICRHIVDPLYLFPLPLITPSLWWPIFSNIYLCGFVYSSFLFLYFTWVKLHGIIFLHLALFLQYNTLKVHPCWKMILRQCSIIFCDWVVCILVYTYIYLGDVSQWSFEGCWNQLALIDHGLVWACWTILLL